MNNNCLNKKKKDLKTSVISYRKTRHAKKLYKKKNTFKMTIIIVNKEEW